MLRGDRVRLPDCNFPSLASNQFCRSSPVDKTGNYEAVLIDGHRESIPRRWGKVVRILAGVLGEVDLFIKR